MKFYYGACLPVALKEVYPEHDWKEWLFHKPPIGIWSEPSVVRRYFDWLGTELHIQKPEDWYSITRDTIFKHRGAGVLEKFDGSFPKALMAAYPEHKWLPWKFLSVPQGWWSDTANQKLFLDYVGQQESYSTALHWYKATDKILMKHGGHRFLKLYAQFKSTKLDFFGVTVASH